MHIRGPHCHPPIEIAADQPLTSIHCPSCGSGHGVAFTPDGKQVVAASGDNALEFWDIATGEETATLRDHEGPDGKRIVAGSSRIPSESCRIPNDSGGRGLSPALRNAPNSGEFSYAQFRRRQLRLGSP